MQDIEDRELTYAMMAKLLLAAAEEHVGEPMRDAGIVALYAKASIWPYSPLSVGCAHVRLPETLKEAD